jgi:hypothetical protein
MANSPEWLEIPTEPEFAVRLAILFASEPELEAVGLAWDRRHWHSAYINLGQPVRHFYDLRQVWLRTALIRYWNLNWKTMDRAQDDGDRGTRPPWLFRTGLLRVGDLGLHPFWPDNLCWKPMLLETHDEKENCLPSIFPGAGQPGAAEIPGAGIC